MSTIGVGKAFRDQDRAARQAREHRQGFGRSTAPSELPAPSGVTTCSSCGDEVPRADLLFAAQGELCPACFGEVEGRAATALVPTSWRQGAGALVRPVPLCLAAGVFAWVGAPMFTELGPVGAKGAIGWFVLVGSVGLLGAVACLQSLRDVLTALRPSLDDGTRAVGLALASGTGLLATLVPTLVLLGLSVAPFVISAL